MTIRVFLGPSLPLAEAERVLDATYLPPVSEGDVYRATLARPIAIGIIDGYFEIIPAVWHKEILYAMSQGIHVFGASSMGALRAAELAPFGMEGVGAIFEAYRDARIEDDDEVAVLHGPAEVGYPSLSEAMVNIRRTLADAAAGGIVGEPTRTALEAAAKALSYRERSYAAILKQARKTDLPEAELARLEAWLPTGAVDQKREDALAMLRVMRERFAAGHEPKQVAFHFEHTTLWEQATRLAAAHRDPD